MSDPEEKHRSIAITDLPGVTPSVANKLMEAGYATPEAVAVATSQELSAIAGIPVTTAQKIIRAAREALDIRFKTALEVKKERMTVQKITTGSRNLDNLLGGGIETKTITEFYGEFGTGKCVSKDTPVIYMNPDRVGLITIEELYRKYAELYGEERMDEGFAVKAPNLKVLAFDGQGFRFAESPLIYRERVRRILEITTESGARIRLTKLHPLLVLGRRGLSWIQAGQVSPGDYIARPRKLILDSRDTGLDEDDAYFLGLFVAKGTRNPLSISLRDEALVSWLESYMEHKFGFKPRVHRDPSGRRPHKILLGKSAEKLLGDLAYARPGELFVPNEVLQAPENIARHFLAGYLEGGGHYSGAAAVEVVAKSRKLALGLTYLMSRLGVRVALRNKLVKGSAHYMLSIKGADREKILGLPFRSKKPRQVGEAKNYDTVPCIVALHLRNIYRKALGGPRGPVRKTIGGNSLDAKTAYRLLLRGSKSGHGYISLETLEAVEEIFRKALEELRRAERRLKAGAGRFPEIYRKLPFPPRRVLAEKLGVSPGTIGNYLSRGLPKEPARRRGAVNALLGEIEARARMLEEALSLITLVKSLEWERIAEVREIEYNDYVYDVVVPGYHTFVGGETPVILHNTQICHQLSVNVQLSPEKGGLAAKAAYIDTEGTFRWERIEAMARALDLDPDEVMENIYYVRAVNSDHQMAVVDELMGLMAKENIRLVAVDSVTGHFRAEYPGRENLAARQQKLNRHLRQLMRLAEIYNAAVVITNQVMARPDVFYGDPTQAVGGHVLYHAPGVRVHLRKSKGGKRIARIVDAPHLPEGEAVFMITEYGIRDLEE